MNKLVNEELDKMKYLLGYQKGKVISEQAAPAAAPSTVEDVVKQIQTVLKSKYGANLGTSGPNKDGVDGKWGNLTQTAFETAIKTKSAPTATTPEAPAATTPAAPAATTPAAPAATTPAAPAATTPAAPAATTPTAENPADIMGTEVPAQQQLNQTSQQALSGQLTPQQIRQQSRFDQRLARQARRTDRRAGQ